MKSECKFRKVCMGVLFDLTARNDSATHKLKYKHDCSRESIQKVLLLVLASEASNTPFMSLARAYAPPLLGAAPLCACGQRASASVS